MNLTIEEAKDKMCPFLVENWCVGDVCMAWKWTKFKNKSEEVTEFSEMDKLYHVIKKTITIPTHGICELIFKSK